MKRLIKYILILLVSASGTACKKSMLEVVDNSTLNRQSYVKDLTTMEHFMNGNYLMLNNALFEYGIGAAYPDLVADNLMPLLSGVKSLTLQYSWSQKATDMTDLTPNEESLSMNGNWRGWYMIIRACNFVIEDIDKYRSENPARADQIKGQALGIRALLHFKLVNIFAQTYSFTTEASHPGIPYITTSDISAPYHRHTVAEVYQYLVEDLKKAAQLLPGSLTDLKVMNKAAANALLARVYLFKGDFVNARSLAVEVANQFPLMTIAAGYPAGIFKDKSHAQTEALFQLAPINYSRTNKSRYLGFFLRGAYILYNATNDIAVVLKENPNDIRSQWVTETSGRWNVTKFPADAAQDVVPAISESETAYYPSVIRSSEMVLTAAEAAARLNDEASARSYIDAIRKRADPSIAPITATGTALLDSIFKERRKELAFEGLRMFDLQRWRMNVIRNDVHPDYTMAKVLPFPNDKAIAPIPIQDIRLAGLTANPGY